MENENVIGKVCFAILRKGFVAGLRISLELDSPGCIIGCKFDGAGIVGNTVIDDSDILLHITSHGIQTEKGHTTGDRSVFYIGVGAALKLTPDEVLRLPNEELLCIIRGHNILKLNKLDFTRHPMAKQIVKASVYDYQPAADTLAPTPTQSDTEPVPPKKATRRKSLYSSAQPPSEF